MRLLFAIDSCFSPTTPQDATKQIITEKKGYKNKNPPKVISITITPEACTKKPILRAKTIFIFEKYSTQPRTTT